MRKPVTEGAIIAALADVARAVQIRQQNHGDGAYVSTHEVYGMMAEEVKELLDAIHEGDPRLIERELKDIAVVSVWGIIGIKTGKTEVL